VQDESQLQDAASKLEAGSAEQQAKAKLGASFLSVQKATLSSTGRRRPEARSVPHCHALFSSLGSWTFRSLVAASLRALLAVRFVRKPLFSSLGSWTMLDVSRLGGGQAFEPW